jgi:HSP20 family molecular chaperone IbpA
MAGFPVKLVVITPDEEATFRKRLTRLREDVQRRAWEIHCQRCQPVEAVDDWRCAERETMLCPLAGIETDSGRVRVTAAVPGLDPNKLLVEVLPDAIFVELDPAKQQTPPHYSVFPLRERINPFLARATFEQGRLTIVAPTTGVPSRNAR